MSKRLASLTGCAVVVLITAAGHPFAQQDEAPWQTSWAAFVAVLGPEPGSDSVSAYRQFEGKTVTWEGVVGAASSETTTFPMDMTPHGASGYEVSLQVTPKARELPRWRSLAVGTRLRFKGRIASLFPVRVTRVDAAYASLVAAVFVNDGELVIR